VGGTAGVGVHPQLQNTAELFRQVWHQEVDRCRQTHQGQVAGQSGVHAVAQGVIGQGQSGCE